MGKGCCCLSSHSIQDLTQLQHVSRFKTAGKPLTRKELDRRRHVVDSTLKLRQEIEPIGIPAEELIRRVR